MRLPFVFGEIIMNDNLLKAGKIVNTHALRGEVRIFPYCDDADFLCEFDVLYINGEPKEIASARVHKGQALVRFEGIDSINAAEALVGSIVYIDKDDIELEEGRYFIEDLKGCMVYDVDSGECYGKVTNVIQTGANDVFEVTKEDKTVLIPKIDDVIIDIDIDSRRITIKPMKGLFE